MPARHSPSPPPAIVRPAPPPGLDAAVVQALTPRRFDAWLVQCITRHRFGAYRCIGLAHEQTACPVVLYLRAAVPAIPPGELRLVGAALWLTYPPTGPDDLTRHFLLGLVPAWAAALSDRVSVGLPPGRPIGAQRGRSVLRRVLHAWQLDANPTIPHPAAPCRSA